MFNWIASIFDAPSYTQEELKSFDKLKLEEIVREWGIELDRRKTKAKLINELLKIEEFRDLDKLELEKIGRKSGIELDRRTTKTKMIKELLKVIKL